MTHRVKTVASSLFALGLVWAVVGCSGGSGSDPDVSASAVAPTVDIADELDMDDMDSDDFDDEAVPVPFMDPKTGETFILMINSSQAECVLKQDMEGVTDIDTVIAACNIDKKSILR